MIQRRSLGSVLEMGPHRQVGPILTLTQITPTAAVPLGDGIWIFIPPAGWLVSLQPQLRLFSQLTLKLQLIFPFLEVS